MPDSPRWFRSTTRCLVTAVALAGVLLGLTGAGATRTLAAGAPHDGWSKGPGLPTTYKGAWDTASAYFPPKDQVVLFGGSPKITGESWNSETWLLSADKWSKGPAAPAGLTPRGGAAMGYDPDIGKVVLFSGGGKEWPYPHDVWLWDGTKWSPGPAAPAGMKGRVGARMAYDGALHKLVLFGGSGDAPYRDTWLFNGTSWTQGPAAPAGMGPRMYFGMTYDPVLQKVLVAGGGGGTDSWYFDGTSWAAGPSLAPIGPKERFSMDYDPQLL